MVLNNQEATIIVTKYIEIVNSFLNNQSNEFQNYFDYSVSQIFFIIGKYNLVNELNLMISNEKLIEYYKYVNLFYYAMIAGVHFKNQEIVDILTKSKNMSVESYQQIVNNLMKHNDREFTKLAQL